MPTRFLPRYPRVSVILILLSIAGVTKALPTPQNLLEFYDAIRAQGRCHRELASGFYSRDNGPNSMPMNPLPVLSGPKLS